MSGEQAGTRTKVAGAVLAALAVLSAGALAGAQADRGGGGVPTPRAGAASPTENSFVPITPCRIVNTQNPAGKLDDGEARQYKVQGDTSSQGGAAQCGIPIGATAVEMTITAVSAEGRGYLRAGPAGFPTPTATFLNYGPGQNLGNTGTVAVSGGAGANLRVQVFEARTHLVIDVSGYYVKDLHASVAADGSLARGNGLVNGNVWISAGTYQVVFDRNVSGCAYAVSIGNPVQGTPGPGYAVATPGTSNADSVFVQTFDTDGEKVNRAFHLTVTC